MSSQIVKCIFEVQSFDTWKVAFRLVRNAKKHVHPLLIEFTAGMIVATLVQSWQFGPLVILEAIHFARRFGLIGSFSRSSHTNVTVHETANWVTVSWVFHLGSLHEIPGFALRVEHELARFFHLFGGYVEITTTNEVNMRSWPQLHILKVVGQSDVRFALEFVMDRMFLESVLFAIVNDDGLLILNNHEHVFGGWRKIVRWFDNCRLIATNNLLDTFLASFSLLANLVACFYMFKHFLVLEAHLAARTIKLE